MCLFISILLMESHRQSQWSQQYLHGAASITEVYIYNEKNSRNNIVCADDLCCSDVGIRAYAMAAGR